MLQRRRETFNTDAPSRPRRLLLLHIRAEKARRIPQSALPPPRRQHKHVPHRSNSNLLLRRQRRLQPSPRLHIPSPTENRLRNRHPDDRHRRSHKWPRRCEIHLRAHFPGSFQRSRTHGPEQFCEHWDLGPHRYNSMGYSLDHRGSYPRVQ